MGASLTRHHDGPMPRKGVVKAELEGVVFKTADAGGEAPGQTDDEKRWPLDPRVGHRYRAAHASLKLEGHGSVRRPPASGRTAVTSQTGVVAPVGIMRSMALNNEVKPRAAVQRINRLPR